MGIPNLLTVDEFAEWTRLSGSTIRRKCATGEIASYRFGERIRIPAPELPDFLAKHATDTIGDCGAAYGVCADGSDDTDSDFKAG